MRRYLDADTRQLRSGWQVAVTESGAWQRPSDLVEADFGPAQVPGTVAGALAALGRFEIAQPMPLQELDAWYRCLLAEPAGEAVLRFEGLATIAEVYLNSELIGRSNSMFTSLDLAVSLTGSDEVVIKFAALTDALATRGPRALWRPRLLDNQGLRLVRTTLLGHMPGWCPSVQAVGPYRPVSLIRPGRIRLDDVRVAAELTEDGTGLLAVSVSGAGVGALISCAGVSAPLVSDGTRAIATLVIGDVEPWWPATHGTPKLYDIEFTAGEASSPPQLLARTGFRHLEVGEEAFAVRINGEPIFCRGAVWTNADLLTLSGSRETYAPVLARIAAAGFNMVRVPGIATYESAAFYELCDELGILVFADFMFANFDYPASDETFAALVNAEVRQFLLARQANPSLVALCAGSEIAQQAAMLGLPPQRWYSELATVTLPGLVAEYRPDVAYLPGSPSGGPLPFSVDAGVGHYFGVGAYERGLDDARRANVGFATECLAFANLPDDPHLLDRLAAVGPDDELWQLGVPADPGTAWDFADTRDPYLGRLYGHDPEALRRSDPSAYLAFSRAVTAEVVTETFTEWRRAGSSCAGALVFNLSDLGPGAGWGVLDVAARPKSTFRALARAFRPVSVGLTDEGVNGLLVQLINETAQTVAATVEIFGLKDGSVIVGRAERELQLEPRSTLAIPATDLYEGFFDYTYAYRFGPPAHEVSVARLRVAGQIVSEAFAFPLGRSAALAAATIDAEVVEKDGGWAVQLTADRFAQSLHLRVDGYEPADDWFHLSPDAARTVALTPLPGTDAGVRPSGVVGSLSGPNTAF